MESDPDKFWRFSLAAYARPGVAEACLALQDDHGFDVNLILFCCWLAEDRSAELSDAELRLLLAQISPVNAEAVWPLRRARKWLKAAAVGDGSEAIQARRVRRLVKTAELEAERLAQHCLVTTPAAVGVPGERDAVEAASRNLMRYARVLAALEAQELLTDLPLLILEGPASQDPPS